MSAGQLQQLATPDEIYDFPANRFVAEFIGSPPMNLLPAEKLDGEIVAIDDWHIPFVRSVPNGPVDLGLRPEAIEIVEEDGHPAKIFLVEPLGSEAIVHLRLNDKDIRVRVESHNGPKMGSTVQMRAIPEGIRLFDRTSGKALNA